MLEENNKSHRLAVGYLRCEYKVNPLGIDVNRPRLCWEIESGLRDVKQTAYRITAASTIGQLKDEKELLWDSGRRQSDQSIHIEYQGKTPESRQRIYWRVQVWDNHGNDAVSAETVWWEMALLDTADWKAVWITQPWENDREKSARCAYFRKSFTIKRGVKSARIYEIWAFR